MSSHRFRPLLFPRTCLWVMILVLVDIMTVVLAITSIYVVDANDTREKRLIYERYGKKLDCCEGYTAYCGECINENDVEFENVIIKPYIDAYKDYKNFKENKRFTLEYQASCAGDGFQLECPEFRCIRRGMRWKENT